ncbi:MAG: hypothetical protein ACRD0G_05795, partial [Acidimicrobiales bacterium]
AGLPDAWQPGERGRAPAGLGEVRQIGGAAAAGRWGDVLEPTPTISSGEFGIGGFVPEPVSAAVARDAGLESLDVPWLLAFLLIYVAVVGPLAWLVLRRRQRAALGWVAIPAVAAIFTGGAFVVGSDLRGSTRAAHASVVELSPSGVARVTSSVGVVSRDGGDANTRFPERWVAGGVDQSFFGGPTSDVAVVAGVDGPETRLELGAGDFGVVSASGPSPFEGQLTVDATAAADGTVTGTVHNDTPFDLDEVGVMVGRSGDNIGSVDAGSSADFELTRRRNIDPFAPVEVNVWPRASGWNGPVEPDSIVNVPAWADSVARLGANAATTGIVTVVGWTRAYASPADVAGQGEPPGRSAIVTRATVSADGGAVPATSVHREAVRGFGATELPDVDDAPGGVEGMVWRYALPAGADPAAALELVVPGYVARADVWGGSAWVPVIDHLDERVDERIFGNPTRGEPSAVPAGVVHDGIVWVRGWVHRDFGPIDGTGLELRGVQ